MLVLKSFKYHLNLKQKNIAFKLKQKNIAFCMNLGAARLLLLVVLLTFCWTFFPPTQHTFDRLKVVSINITNSIEYNEAMSQILFIIQRITRATQSVAYPLA